MTKMWGLANGNIGWANEPSDYIEAITIIESVSNQIQQEEMDASRTRQAVAAEKAKTKKGR